MTGVRKGHTKKPNSKRATNDFETHSVRWKQPFCGVIRQTEDEVPDESASGPSATPTVTTPHGIDTDHPVHNQQQAETGVGKRGGEGAA